MDAPFAAIGPNPWTWRTRFPGPGGTGQKFCAEVLTTTRAETPACARVAASPRYRPGMGGGSRRPKSNAVGRRLRLMGRSGPFDGTASSEGGYADQASLGFLTNVSRASNSAGPIAADAGMLAVQTRDLRRRAGSRPRPQRHPDACRAAAPRRCRVNVSFRPGRFPGRGPSPRLRGRSNRLASTHATDGACRARGGLARSSSSRLFRASECLARPRGLSRGIDPNRFPVRSASRFRCRSPRLSLYGGRDLDAASLAVATLRTVSKFGGSPDRLVEASHRRSPPAPCARGRCAERLGHAGVAVRLLDGRLQRCHVLACAGANVVVGLGLVSATRRRRAVSIRSSACACRRRPAARMWPCGLKHAVPRAVVPPPRRLRPPASRPAASRSTRTSKRARARTSNPSSHSA